MLVIVAASRACKSAIFIKRSKVRKVNHAFLPEGIRIEGLLPCLVSQLAPLTELPYSGYYSIRGKFLAPVVVLNIVGKVKTDNKHYFTVVHDKLFRRVVL